MSNSGLQDTHRRVINYLRISVTDRCNLRCVYCMPEIGVSALRHQDILTYEEILRVARLAAELGIRKIRITGGEPLVRRDVVGFLGRLARLPSLEDLSLTTNGLLLGPMARDLRKAGLRRVNVSLDTLRPEVFERITRRPGLQQVLAGLEAARAAGLSPIKVNVVALRGLNDGEILEFAAFAREGGYEVRFIEFMPSSADAWSAGGFLPASEILETLRSRYALVPVEERSSVGPSRTYRLNGGGTVGIISPLTEHFCGRCNRLRLTASGSLRSCLFSDREIDLRPILRSQSGDPGLTEAIRRAVHEKPRSHTLLEEDRHKCGLTMSRVGG